jgi:CheY-like chemotaxis protein
MVKLFVIDDEPNTVELTKAVLELAGFEIFGFGSGTDALSELHKGNIPDLILLDIRMPVMSGPDFCEKIQAEEKFKKIKIVFFTASSEINKDMLQKYGVLGFVFKPFDMDQIVKDVNRYLGM